MIGWGIIAERENDVVDDVTVWVMGRPNSEALLTHVPGLHLHLTKRIDHRLEEYEVKIGDLVFKDATRKIISFVARYGQDFDGSGNRLMTVDKSLSYQDIANLTGTSPETVATAMNEIQRKELIECSGQSLVSHDIACLTNLAR
jgi:CRP/FNR family transcriptional regulator